MAALLIFDDLRSEGNRSLFKTENIINLSKDLDVHDGHRSASAANFTGAPNGNFRENICSEDDLRTRIFGTFVVKFLACLPLLGFLNIYKMV